MNPMSLLTLPVTTLREASARVDAPASGGKRGERFLALAGCVVAIVLALVFSLS